MKKIKGIKINHLLGSILLGAGLGLLGFSFVITNNLIYSRFKAYVITSGSMEPAIKTGSVVFTLSQPTYLQGDIISFTPSDDKKNVVTHRVNAKIIEEGSRSPIYYTSGDANENIDNWKIKEDQIIGKVAFSVPFIGYIVDFAKTPKGFVILIVIPATIIIYEELKALGQEIKKTILKGKKKSSPLPIFIAFLFPSLIAGMYFISTSNSFLFDLETSEMNVLSAATSFGSPSPSPSASPLPSPTIRPSPTPAGNTTEVIISEIQINGSNANQDFVELYNTTNSDIDISLWKLRKRTSNGTESSLDEFGNNQTIPAHGFYLWANSQGGYAASVGADTSTGNNISENNSIALRKADNTLVDSVAWGSGTNTYVEGTALINGSDKNTSLERKANSASTQSSMMSGIDSSKGNGYDSNDNSNDFILRTLSEPQNSGSTIEIP